MRIREILDATPTFSVEAACHMYKHPHDSAYLGGNANYDTGLSIEVDWRIRNV